MGATNEVSGGNKSYYRLREVGNQKGHGAGELKIHGQYRFYKQIKLETGKWGDGDSFNQIIGTVTGVKVEDGVYEGQPTKKLIVTVLDGAEVMVVNFGFSNTATTVINTLAGGNGFDLRFSCGPAKISNGKSYPSLYVNKLEGLTIEDMRTNWKFKYEETPKTEKITDEDGNAIVKGKKAHGEFWSNVVAEISKELESTAVSGTILAGFSEKERIKKAEAEDSEWLPRAGDEPKSDLNPFDSDLPF